MVEEEFYTLKSKKSTENLRLSTINNLNKMNRHQIDFYKKLISSQLTCIKLKT